MPAGSANGEGKEEARAEEDEGVREGGAEHVEDRGRVEPGIAEVAARGVQSPRPPPLEDGAVQAVERLEAQRVLGGEIRVRGHHEVDGVARHEPDEGVHHDGHHPEDQRRLPQPAEDKGGHGGRGP